MLRFSAKAARRPHVLNPPRSTTRAVIASVRHAQRTSITASQSVSRQKCNTQISTGRIRMHIRIGFPQCQANLSDSFLSASYCTFRFGFFRIGKHTCVHHSHSQLSRSHTYRYFESGFKHPFNGPECELKDRTNGFVLQAALFGTSLSLEMLPNSCPPSFKKTGKTIMNS